MLAFRLRKEAKKWFRHVSGQLPLEFDAFYFCLLAGLATARKTTDAMTADTTELVDYFPGDYRTRGRLIVALLLSRELKVLGIELGERALLHQEIQKLIDPLSSSHLSELGMREANRYAFAGYDVLDEWFGGEPQYLDAFLVQFAQRIAEAEAAR